MIPSGRLLNFPEEMFRNEASPAPANDPKVDPKLFIDIKRANNVPSIPGGHSCPDSMRNGINLQRQERKNIRLQQHKHSISDYLASERMHFYEVLDRKKISKKNTSRFDCQDLLVITDFDKRGEKL